MREYIKASTKTNTLILDQVLNKDEIVRFSKADYRWAENYKKDFPARQVRKGEIYQFEFGKNYVPEMSFEHRGLVLGINKKLLYVLPIFTYNPKKHPDVYHLTDCRESKSDLFLMKKTEYPFIQHDSVMKLNDIRTVSVNRILYRQKDGKIDIHSAEFRKIEELVLTKYFPGYLYEYRQSIQQLDELRKNCIEQQKKIIELEELLKNNQIVN